MQITITCNSTEELRDLVNSLVVLQDDITQEKARKSSARKARAESAPAAGEKKQKEKVSVDDIRKLKEYGLKPEQIAEKLGCSKATVYNKLKE